MQNVPTISPLCNIIYIYICHWINLENMGKKYLRKDGNVSKPKQSKTKPDAYFKGHAEQNHHMGRSRNGIVSDNMSSVAMYAVIHEFVRPVCLCWVVKTWGTLYDSCTGDWIKCPSFCIRHWLLKTLQWQERDEPLSKPIISLISLMYICRDD